MSGLLLGVDIGFSSLKSTLVRVDDVSFAGSASNEIRSSSPVPGWSDPTPGD